jgi:uncharacterized protein YciI
MELFAVIGFDHPPHSMDKRDAVRSEHRAYVAQNGSAITCVGPLLDDDNNQCGSFYIFEADNEQQIREWLEKEPFYRTGVYQQLVIRRFKPGYSRLPKQEWRVAFEPKP